MSCLRAQGGRRERRDLYSPTSSNGMEIREQRGEGEREKEQAICKAMSRDEK